MRKQNTLNSSILGIFKEKKSQRAYCVGVLGHEPSDEISGHTEECDFDSEDTDNCWLIFKRAAILPGVS